MMKGFNFYIKTAIFFFLFSTILTSCTDNKEESLKFVDKGVESYYNAKYDEAYKYFKKAIDADENNFEAWYWMGNYYNNQRRYKKAIEYFTKSIELNPGFADSYANRGFAKNYLKDKKGACEDWKKARDLGRDNLDNQLQWCN